MEETPCLQDFQCPLPEIPCRRLQQQVFPKGDNSATTGNPPIRGVQAK